MINSHAGLRQLFSCIDYILRSRICPSVAFSFDIIKTFLLIYQNFSLYLKVQTPCLLPRTLEMINYASQVYRLSSDFISKVGEIIINKRINIIHFTLL